MPDELKQELLHYAEYLLAKYPSSKEIQEGSEKRPLAGSMKGTFVLPLPNDFDKPL